jgi:hypothetical protein
LRRQCYALGLIDEQGEPIDFESPAPQTIDVDEVDAGRETSEYVKFPLLLPNPAATSNICYNNQENILEWQASSGCITDMSYDDDDSISLYSASLTGVAPLRNESEANEQIQSTAAAHKTQPTPFQEQPSWDCNILHHSETTPIRNRETQSLPLPKKFGEFTDDLLRRIAMFLSHEDLVQLSLSCYELHSACKPTLAENF